MTRVHRFAFFTFDAGAGELRSNGRVARLRPQAAQVLALLMERAGQVVSRDEIYAHVWPDTFVEFDQSLNSCIHQLRAALGETAEAPQYIETIPKRGYRFIAPLQPTKRVWSRRLTWGALAAGVALVTVTVGAALIPRDRLPVRLAVMPFVELAGDSQAREWGSGLTEELIVALAAGDPQGLEVMGRTSSMRYRDGKVPLSEIRAELDVTHVVEGSIRVVGDWGARIVVRLVRTDDGVTVWSEAYDQPRLDVALVQRAVAAEVRRALDLRAAGDRSPRQETTSSEAWSAYLTGRHYLLRGDSAGLAESRKQFAGAVAADSTYASAWVGLLTAAFRQGDVEAARVFGARALALDPGVAGAHHQLGVLELFADWDVTAARRHFARALATSPSDPELLHDYALLLAILGEETAAILQMERAVRLDPVSPMGNGDAGWLHIYAGRYAAAARLCQQAVDLVPQDPRAHGCVIAALDLAGDVAGARDRATLLVELLDGDPTAIGVRSADAAEGLEEYYRWSLARLAGRPGTAMSRAYRWARLREPERALDALTEAVDGHEALAVFLGVDPRLASLRTDPRFKTLATRVGVS